MSRISRILCAVDFDEASRQALAYSLSLARDLHASVTVLHAFEVPVYPVPEDGMVELPVELEEDLKMRLEERLTEYVTAERSEGDNVEWQVLEGQPDDVVCNFALSLPADLVVVGTHGRTGFAHLLLGSTAERIVRNCRVPVLSVRGKAA